VDAIPPVRGRPGNPPRKPGEVTGDRGYHDGKRRMTLSGRGIPTAIARRGDPHGSGFPGQSMLPPEKPPSSQRLGRRAERLCF
jgi:hypothetical protein